MHKTSNTGEANETASINTLKKMKRGHLRDHRTATKQGPRGFGY